MPVMLIFFMLFFQVDLIEEKHIVSTIPWFCGHAKQTSNPLQVSHCLYYIYYINKIILHKYQCHSDLCMLGMKQDQ